MSPIAAQIAASTTTAAAIDVVAAAAARQLFVRAKERSKFSRKSKRAFLS